MSSGLVLGNGSTPDRVVLPAADSPTLTQDAEQRIREALSASQSASTARNYRQDWERFQRWCSDRGHTSFPAHPIVLCDYLTDAASLRTPTGERAYSPATLKRWVAGINYWHLAAGAHTGPGAAKVVKETLAGIRRTYAANQDRPTRRAAPLLQDDIETLVTVARNTATTWTKQLVERRDSAILTMGFFGAFRRSEIAALHTNDVVRHTLDGLHVRLPRSKTDQFGEGNVKGLKCGQQITLCPVCAYRRWAEALWAWDFGGRPAVIALLHAAAPFDDHVCREPFPIFRSDGVPVFRAIYKHGQLSATPLSGATVHALIRRRAQLAGFDPTRVDEFSGHSLRTGLISQAVRNGSSNRSIRRQTGHKSDAMIDLYTREFNPLDDNAINDMKF